VRPYLQPARGGSSAGYWDTADKGELTRLIAAAGKSGLTDRENVRRAYKKALETVRILDASQKQTDAAAEALKKALASPDKADALALTFAEPVYDTGKPKLYGNGYVTFDDLFNDAGKGTMEW